MPPGTGSVVVIGAGIVGVTTALELQRHGRSVTLVDREGPAAGCSRGNGGAIGPNTCTPFALPGILRRIPKWYLDPDGPVTVHAAWALRSAPWIRYSGEAAARRSAASMRFLHEGCLWMSFFGLFAVYRMKKDIVIDILVRRFTRPVAAAVRALPPLVVLAVSVTLLAQAPAVLQAQGGPIDVALLPWGGELDRLALSLPLALSLLLTALQSVLDLVLQRASGVTAVAGAALPEEA